MFRTWVPIYYFLPYVEELGHLKLNFLVIFIGYYIFLVNNDRNPNRLILISSIRRLIWTMSYFKLIQHVAH